MGDLLSLAHHDAVGRGSRSDAINLPESGLMAPVCSGVSANGETEVVFAACVVDRHPLFRCVRACRRNRCQRDRRRERNERGICRALIPYLLETRSARMSNRMIDPVRFRSSFSLATVELDVHENSPNLPLEDALQLVPEGYSRITTNRTGMPSRLFVGALAVASDSTVPC